MWCFFNSGITYHRLLKWKWYQISNCEKLWSPIWYPVDSTLSKSLYFHFHVSPDMIIWLYLQYIRPLFKFLVDFFFWAGKPPVISPCAVMNPQVISRNVHLMPLDFGMSDDHDPGLIFPTFSQELLVQPTTLPKTKRLEPENHPFWKGKWSSIHLHFRGFHVSFRGSSINIIFTKVAYARQGLLQKLWIWLPWCLKRLELGIYTLPPCKGS